MPGIDVKENTIRVRQRNPGDFEEGTFKTIRLTNGVKAVVAKPKGKKSTVIQTLIFDKNRFDKKAVQDWLKEHKSRMSMAIDMEQEKERTFASTKMELQSLKEKIEELFSWFEEDDMEEQDDLSYVIESLSTRLDVLEQRIAMLETNLPQSKNSNSLHNFYRFV